LPRACATSAEGGRGCNITVPFKFEAPALATRSERVRLAGAANTLSFAADGSIHADNTDGLGLVADITRNAGVPWPGATCCWWARAAPPPACWARCCRRACATSPLPTAPGQGPGAGGIAQRPGSATKSRAAALAPQALEGDFDVIINATASSLAGAAVPVPASVLRPGSLAYDMMYGPAAQGFLDWARQHGAWRATAWACWWNRPPRRLPSGAACARHRPRCWKNCAAPRTDPAMRATARHALQRPGAHAMKALLRWLGLVLLALVGLQLFFVLRIAAMAAINPESTTFQRSEAWTLLASKGSVPWRQQWVPYAQISDHLKRAVIASEDDGFVNHEGVDWNAIEKAWERNAKAEAQAAKAQARAPDRPVRAPKIRGGSTITQQLAKNLLLSGERTLLRKGQEFVLTLALEQILSKSASWRFTSTTWNGATACFGAEAAAPATTTAKAPPTSWAAA
jgi:monofunctional biosynthetic peptidoglycan transglycosylase